MLSTLTHILRKPHLHNAGHKLMGCTKARVGAGRRAWAGASPRTEVACTETHCIYERLWYNNGHFYLLVDGDTPVVHS